MKTLLLLAALFFSPSFAQAGVGGPTKAAKDNCGGFDQCAVVYLAPWCPHCQRAVPQLQEIRKQVNAKKKFGLRVVVGMGKPTEMQKMADEFGENGKVDGDGRIAKDLRVNGVPQYYVVGKDGKATMTGTAAWDWMQEQLK